jgi:hypothetical protein
VPAESQDQSSTDGFRSTPLAAKVHRGVAGIAEESISNFVSRRTSTTVYDRTRGDFKLTCSQCRASASFRETCSGHTSCRQKLFKLVTQMPACVCASFCAQFKIDRSARLVRTRRIRGAAVVSICRKIHECDHHNYQSYNHHHWRDSATDNHSQFRCSSRLLRLRGQADSVFHGRSIQCYSPRATGF